MCVCVFVPCLRICALFEYSCIRVFMRKSTINRLIHQTSRVFVYSTQTITSHQKTRDNNSSYYKITWLLTVLLKLKGPIRCSCRFRCWLWFEVRVVAAAASQNNKTDYFNFLVAWRIQINNYTSSYVISKYV